ncbi:MAG: hypothetical protein M5U01_03070 [Ardenticatenaceae bacterium]|nr:hypothetical protein [Ardenticatenaceae bacterium]
MRIGRSFWLRLVLLAAVALVGLLLRDTIEAYLLEARRAQG